MDKKIVVVERTYEAPIESVWEALTNKDQMKQWYFDVSDFKAEVGFEFEFTGSNKGKTYIHKCKVVEVNPVTKLSYTWRYEGYVGESLVTFELSSESKNKTRLKLTHSDLDTFSKDAGEFAPENFNKGWKSLLEESLARFVEKVTSRNRSASTAVQRKSRTSFSILINTGAGHSAAAQSPKQIGKKDHP